jgi:hypothetical protein
MLYNKTMDKIKQTVRRHPVYSIIVSLILLIGVSLGVQQAVNTPPASAPAPQSVTPGNYPVHNNVHATVFWVGEPGDADNDFIQNRSSVWMEDWQSAYGGVDDPANRCGDYPCGLTPKENPYYFALPFNDYDGDKLKSADKLKPIYWYSGSVPAGTSIIKNRWIKITNGNKTAYAQWEDAGPFGEGDAHYVFGPATAKPKEKRAGLDLGPATAKYLGVPTDGDGYVSWQFVDAKDVPAGPWKQIVTTSNPTF